MKRICMTMCAAALVLAGGLITGCATARVENEARCTVTAPDGTVTERFAKNKIFAMGDKAVEQNLKGSLADATEGDLSAGIQESAQKSESGVIAQGMFALGGKALELGVEYLKGRPVAAVASPAPPGTASAATTPAVVSEAVQAAEPDAPAVAYSSDGFNGAFAAAGMGVYGHPACSRCRAFIAARPGFEMVNVDVPANQTAMWAALRRLGYTGQRVDLPVIITDSAYTVGAK